MTSKQGNAMFFHLSRLLVPCLLFSDNTLVKKKKSALSMQKK